MNLSAGLRLDAISAGASCSFLEACQSFYRVTAHVDVTYCLDIMHHALFTTCAYTPQQKIKLPQLSGSLSPRDCCFSVWDFSQRSTFGPDFLASQGPGIERKYLSCGCSFLLWDACSCSALGFQLFILSVWSTRCAFPQVCV